MAMSRRYALIVFVLALAIRLAYAGLAGQDPANLRAPDSVAYTTLADAMLASGGFNHPQGDGFFAETERTPAYVVYLAAVQFVFGRDPVWPVLGQCLLDSLTCLLIGALASYVRPQLFLVAGIGAAVNLNLIAHSALVLTDSLFVLLLTGSLLAAVRFMQRPSLADAALAGALTALAILTRAVLAYFVPFVVGAMLLAAWRHRLGAPAMLRYGTVCLLSLGVLVGPLLLRNAHEYGRYRLVSQTGGHAMLWVVPMARELASGVSASTTQDEMYERLKVHLGRQGLTALPSDPFEASDQFEAVARQALSELGAVALAKAWFIGTSINLLAPSVTAVQALNTQTRPRFSTTSGATPYEKIWNILSHAASAPYLVLLAAAAGLTLVLRGIQAIGFWKLMTGDPSARGPVWYLLIFALYIVAMTGPIVGPKYRLPLEPVLMVGLAAGLHALYERIAARKPS
jgi:4-amino-4-deoxy-L-arabinose transferase-like glycosyltransferase